MADHDDQTPLVIDMTHAVTMQLAQLDADVPTVDALLTHVDPTRLVLELHWLAYQLGIAAYGGPEQYRAALVDAMTSTITQRT